SGWLSWMGMSVTPAPSRGRPRRTRATAASKVGVLLAVPRSKVETDLAWPTMTDSRGAPPRARPGSRSIWAPAALAVAVTAPAVGEALWVSTRDSPQARLRVRRLATGRFSTNALAGAWVWSGWVTSLVLTVPETRATPAPDALADEGVLTTALDWPMVTWVPK